MYQDRERRDYEVRKSNKVYVSNLSSSINEDELQKLFAQFGAISSVNLKQKQTINFAFIQFSSVSQAEAAISDMNGKSIGGQEIKVQFARGGNDRRGGFGDRGRGRSYGDSRGGYQNNRSNDYGGDRPPRRDFGDKPRGCFNCGEEGHMIKDCPKPRKPREFNNREGGFERRGGYNRQGGEERSYGNRNYDRGDRGERGSFNNKGYGDRGGYGSRGGDYKRSDKRGGSSGSRSRSNQKRGGHDKRRRSPSSSSR